MTFADHLATRLWQYDGGDRKVEVWLRNSDGKFRVVRLHKQPGKRVWREVDGMTFDGHAEAQEQAEWWRRLEEGRMP